MGSVVFFSLLKGLLKGVLKMWVVLFFATVIGVAKRKDGKNVISVVFHHCYR